MSSLPAPAPIRPIPFADALSRRYLAYALSTITARSLPDVRDGLKPVQRRVLYAMLKLRLDPDAGYKKCARVVGDVIGKYHPHGEVAIYDAMVRLAQEFAQRYPLVDGQGNFGNIDGDNAAAMRYTEARLTEVAARPARRHRRGHGRLPRRPTTAATRSRWSCRRLSRTCSPTAPAASRSAWRPASRRTMRASCAGRSAICSTGRTPRPRLCSSMSGGPICRPAACWSSPGPAWSRAYRTGRGSLRLRARWQREELGHGQYQVVVSEIPYQVPKARLIERIAELLALRKLSLLADVRDESAEEVRLVLVPRARTRAGRAADGAAVPPDRARGPPAAQPERARRRGRAAGDEPAPGAARLPRASHGGADPALAPPLGQDRGPARGARRLSDRLSQPRRGDPHHPRGGRAQGGADARFRAHRAPGRGDPEHAPAPSAPPRGAGADQGAAGAQGRGAGAEGAARGRGKAPRPAEGGDRGDRRQVRRRPARARGARPSARCR